MKKRAPWTLLCIAASVLICIGALLWWRSATTTLPAAGVVRNPAIATQRETALSPTPPSAPPVSVPAAAQTPEARSAGSALAAELNAPTSTAARDVEILQTLLRDYLRHLGTRQGLPIGNDSDLARVLTGRNPMRFVLIPATHPAITAEGRLCDRWGTPYFIHPRGRGAFEIRSAGPDRKLFTTDDSVAGGAAGSFDETER